MGHAPMDRAVRNEFESQPQVILTGRITRLAESEFELDAGPRGTAVILYDDVASISFPTPQAPPGAAQNDPRAGRIIEYILVFPLRLIDILLGGLCSPRL